MEEIYYVWEVICQAWWIILLIGMVMTPILWMYFEENNEYESLDSYYFKNNDKDDICEN